MKEKFYSLMHSFKRAFLTFIVLWLAMAANVYAQTPIAATASGENPPNEGLVKLYDGNPNSKWLIFNTTSAYVVYEYATPVVINKYDIVSGNDGPLRDPKDWTIQGSNTNDGTDWVTIDTQTGQTWSGRNMNNSYTFTNSVAYKFIKWDITANGGENIVQASELTFSNRFALALSDVATFSGQSLIFDLAGSSTIFTVSSSQSITFTGPNYITISPSTISPGTSVVTFTAQAFASGDLVEGSIIATRADQYFGLIPYSYDVVFTSNPSNINFNNKGGNIIATVTSNIAMQSQSNADVSIQPSDIINGTTVITVTALSNTLYRTKTGTIDFSVGTLLKKINYSQDASDFGVTNDLFVYEPFDYVLANVDVANISGGIGLSGNLSIGNNGSSNSNASSFKIKNNAAYNYSLLSSAGNFYTGGLGGNNGEASVRAIDLTNTKVSSLINGDGTIGVTGKTLYTSFVISKTAPWRDHETTLTLFNGTDPHDGNNRMVEFGYFAYANPNNGGPYPISIRSGTNNSVDPSNVGSITEDSPNLLVLKMEFGVTEHTFTGFINPTPGSTEPTVTVGPVVYAFNNNTSGFSKIAFQLGNDGCCYGANNAGLGSGMIDEIRIGNTFEAVTPAVSVSISAEGNPITIPGNGTTLQFSSIVTSPLADAVTWSVISTTDGIATIDPSSGLLTVSGNQQAVITVVGSITQPTNLSATYVLFVTQVPVSATGISINGGASGKVNINQTVVLTEEYAPVGVNEFGVTWSSSSPSVASVVNGTVTGLALGTVTITATYGLNNSIKATKVITVAVPVTSVSVSGVSLLIVGQTTTLVGTVAPANPTDPTITWSSNNTAIATVVASTGVLTAISEGSVTIIGTSVDGPSASLVLTISPVSANSISISGNNLVVKGATTQLIATVLPANAGNKSVTWTSSDPSIASVSGSGFLTGLSIGTVTITATSVGAPSVSASYEIGVLPINATFIGISGNQNLTVGGVTTLTATVLPSTATDKSIVWSSSNQAIASVTSSTGIVTAISVGVVTITASTIGSSSISAMVTLTVVGDGGLTATINELSAAINLFPVPVVDALHVATTSIVKSIKVLNSIGVLVAENKDSATIRFDGLPSGLYLILIETPAGTIRKTVLK